MSWAEFFLGFALASGIMSILPAIILWSRIEQLWEYSRSLDRSEQLVMELLMLTRSELGLPTSHDEVTQ